VIRPAPPHRCITDASPMLWPPCYRDYIVWVMMRLCVATWGVRGRGGVRSRSRAGVDVVLRLRPPVATELGRRLNCAVLAMRYPITDDFAIGLADLRYNLVLGKGEPVARALGLTLPRVVEDSPTPGASTLPVATPPANRNSFARPHSKWRWP
jgi:hypothetical protein